MSNGSIGHAYLQTVASKAYSSSTKYKSHIPNWSDALIQTTNLELTLSCPNATYQTASRTGHEGSIGLCLGCQLAVVFARKMRFFKEVVRIIGIEVVKRIEKDYRSLVSHVGLFCASDLRRELLHPHSSEKPLWGSPEKPAAV